MKRFLVLSALLALAACASGPGNMAPASTGLEKSNMDTSVRPQDDFYEFVNGTWLETTEIPSDRSRWGSFSEIRDLVRIGSRAVIEETAAMDDIKAGSEAQKIADYYNSFLDSTVADEKGLEPVRYQLDAIAAVSNRDELTDVLVMLETEGVGDPLIFFINQDAKDPTRNALHIYQGGLGLPDRDYYLEDDQRFREIREAYPKFIEKLLMLGEQSNAAAKAARIMEIETSLAEAQWSRAESRNRDKTYNKMTMEMLAESAPNFQWRPFLDGIGGEKVWDIIVYQPSFLEAFDKLYGDVSIDDWKAYLTYKSLAGAAPLLSSDFVEASFEFNGRTLTGAEENTPRWKRGVNIVSGDLGEAVGKLYAERYFPNEAKVQMVQLVNNLRSAFLTRLDNLDWMGDATKDQARIKMDKFAVKIGYPDEWQDYSALNITPDDLFANSVNANKYSHFREMAKIGSPVDRSEWGMTPQTVNAGYNPTLNDITFPAAILQPPFFNLEADMAVNYGAIGGAIGHEISHGFDDQGRKGDGDGALKEWWTPEDEAEFEKRAQVMIDQFNGYVAIDSLHVNGQLTLGENIGDLGGLLISYDAYKTSLMGKDAPVIDGFTGDQRFFMGWAQVWREVRKDDSRRQQVISDPHSPARNRVNGIVSNMDLFYEVYNVKPGDGMYIAPEDRVRIW